MDGLPNREPSRVKPLLTSSPDMNNDEPQRHTALPAPQRPNAAARHAKRLTLNFPISTYPAPSDQCSPSTYTMSPLAHSAFPSPTRSSSATPALNEPTDEGYMFLTALAAQERRVLELREELHKAEAELANLKKQWAAGEKGRRRTEVIHHAEVMKPLKSSMDEGLPNGIDPERPGASDLSKLALQTRMSRELDRKSIPRQSNLQTAPENGSISSGRPRTVFKSSRHSRTLSLLSPGGLEPLSDAGVRNTNQNFEPVRGSSHPRSATLPSIDRSDNNKSENNPLVSGSRTQDERNMWRRSMPVTQDGTAEVLMRTGKQMASDFKDGLWTFIEDIRQATVGEEGINGTEARAMQGSNRSGRSPRRLGTDARAQATGSSSLSRTSSTKGKTVSKSGAKSEDKSFWSEFGFDSPDRSKVSSPAPPRRKTGKQKATEPNYLDVDDNWDVWDTPQSKTHTPSSSSSTFPSRRDPSPSTRASSPRTSASFADHKPDDNDTNVTRPDNIPWPAITKLRPSNLTRTASSLMAEWERSLSPSRSPSPNHEAESKELKSD